MAMLIGALKIRLIETIRQFVRFIWSFPDLLLNWNLLNIPSDFGTIGDDVYTNTINLVLSIRYFKENQWKLWRIVW